MLRNLFPVADSGVVRLPRSRDLDIVVVHVAPSRARLDLHRQPPRARRRRCRSDLVARYDDVHGVLDVADLATLVPDLAERTTYACGPRGSPRRAAGATTTEPGFALFTEQFRTTPVAAGEGGTVTFEKNGTVVEADGATPILDAAEDAGVLMPSGCRMGICFGCVLPLREGAVRDLRNGEITTVSAGESDNGGVLIQTCISAAAGPCDIDH